MCYLAGNKLSENGKSRLGPENRWTMLDCEPTVNESMIKWINESIQTSLFEFHDPQQWINDQMDQWINPNVPVRISRSSAMDQ